MKYTGGCHCGAVKYEVETALETVIECNCSHCAMKGLILTFVNPEDFNLLTPDAPLTDYQFNTKRIHHLFCPTCGVQSFSNGETSTGEKKVAINVRCLEGVDLSSLTLKPVNGKEY